MTINSNKSDIHEKSTTPNSQVIVFTQWAYPEGAGILD